MLARAFDASTTPYLTPAGDETQTVAPREADVFPHHVDGIPPGTVETGKYVLRFAWSRHDLHAVQALRSRRPRQRVRPMNGIPGSTTS